MAIVNDYDIVVAGVADMLSGCTERVCVVELDSRMPVVSDVDIILCDLFGSVPGEGVDLSDLLGGGAKVAVYTWRVRADLIESALARGVVGYLTKGMSAAELVAALENIHRGETVVSPIVHNQDEDEQLDRSGRWPGQAAGLSHREADVLALIAKGLSNPQIADAMFLSINTVKTYIRTCYAKIDVATRANAVVWALQHGFDPEPRREITGRKNPA